MGVIWTVRPFHVAEHVEVTSWSRYVARICWPSRKEGRKEAKDPGVWGGNLIVSTYPNVLEWDGSRAFKNSTDPNMWSVWKIWCFWSGGGS